MYHQETWTTPEWRSEPTTADTGALDTVWLEAIARALAHEGSLWRPLVHHDPHTRYFARILRTERVDAWLLTWSSGQEIALHDHGGSSGVVVVVEGELVEHAPDFYARPPLRRAG